jgi:outer membrane lipoprotein-sorting protein
MQALLLPAGASFSGAAEEAAGAKAAPERRTSWYAATVAEDEKGQFLMVHFWSKGPLFRSQAVLGGRTILTIVDRTTYYIIDEVMGSGLAIERSEAARAQDTRRERPFAHELDDLLRDGGELVGTEQAAGQAVDVYRLTDDRGRRTIWMSTTTPAVPLRIQTYDRASATTGKVDYVNWLHNPPIPDSFFEPDPRIRFERLGYDAYRKRILQGPVGPAPVLYRHLLHGEGPAQEG